MKILFVGSKDRGWRCLDRLLQEDINVVGAVTERKDDPNKFWDTDFYARAKDEGIPTIDPSDINECSYWIERKDPDLIVMSGYSQILDKEILDIPPEGVINLHAGKLPDYRGGSPLNWAIINGEPKGTCTIHFATEDVDAGDILSERIFSIRRSDDISDVRQKTLEIFPTMLFNTIDYWNIAKENARSQNVDEGTYWYSRAPQDGRIDWKNMSAFQVYNMVRALTEPYPGAFSFTEDGQKFYIWKSSIPDRDLKHTQGRVCSVIGGSVTVMAQDRCIEILEVQPEGEDKMSPSELLSEGEYLQ